MIAQWKKNDNPSLPAFLRSKLQGPQLVGLTEVTQWYAEALSQAIRRTKTSDSKKGIEHAVTASNFPVHLSSAELEKHYDTKARNRTNALRAKVEKHRAEHPGSPPRAMTLQDNAKISEPRIFCAETSITAEIRYREGFSLPFLLRINQESIIPREADAWSWPNPFCLPTTP